MADFSTYPVIDIPIEIESPYVEGEPKPPSVSAPLKKDPVKEAINGAIDGAKKTRWLLLVGGPIATAVVGIVKGISSFKDAEEYNSNIWPQEYKKYQQLIVEYEKELEAFKEKLPSIQAKAKAEKIRKTVTFDGSGSNAIMGLGEEFFLWYLQKYFGNSIKTKKTVTLYENFPYTPDFIFIDNSTGLHIDIEIDEPYRYKDKTPIHYLGDNKEVTRNDHFKSRGWIVLRFAEEQIFTEPEKCCALLSDLIHKLTGKSYKINTVSRQPKLIKRWTRSQATEMAESNFRDSYIPSTFGSQKIAV